MKFKILTSIIFFIIAIATTATSQDSTYVFTADQVKAMAKTSKPLNDVFRANYPDLFDDRLEKTKLNWKNDGLFYESAKDTAFIFKPSEIGLDNMFKLNYSKYYYEIESVQDTTGRQEVVLKVTPR